MTCPYLVFILQNYLQLVRMYCDGGVVSNTIFCVGWQKEKLNCAVNWAVKNERTTRADRLLLLAAVKLLIDTWFVILPNEKAPSNGTLTAYFTNLYL